MKKEEPTCPYCESSVVTQTTAKPQDGEAEFRCGDCGEYFIAPVSG